MSYDITAKETSEDKIIGNLRGIKSDQCAEQVLRALIHAGYEVTVQEKREKVQACCEGPQVAHALTPPSFGGGSAGGGGRF